MPNTTTGDVTSPISPTTQETRIEYNFPEGTPTYYARLFATQVDQYEVMLSFFDPRIPIFSGSAEAIKRQSAQIASVRADCLAKVVVAPERLKELVQVLQTALDTYQQLYGATK